MKKLWFALTLALGCGVSGEERPPGTVGNSTLTVQLHWPWVQQLSPLPGCGLGVESCTVCEGTCSSAPGCDGPYKEHCCSASKEVYASGRSAILRDFSRCSISEPAPGLLSIDCPVNSSTPVYHMDGNSGTHVGGTPYPHTGGFGCTWSPPYPGP